MPPIFKALATITAWILFVGACIMMLTSLIVGTVGGVLWQPDIPLLYPIIWAIAGAYLVLGVCAMILRQKME